MLSHTTVFDSTLQKTHQWLDELVEHGVCEDRARAYSLLRLVLHRLRDSLPADEACDLAAQLPMLVRGFYFEGWRPTHKPIRHKTREAFLSDIRAELDLINGGRAEEAVRAVFAVIASHVTLGEVRDIIADLSADVRTLWPDV